ncbi:hypothetical protein HMPREF9182_0292 [Streptococcus sp. oral taxon 056 str. F0418]|nr:hypothetical protein HMPREF9182_0292 [Streptococcus sp. oral taxon 056 str. F0418]
MDLHIFDLVIVAIDLYFSYIFQACLFFFCVIKGQLLNLSIFCLTRFNGLDILIYLFLNRRYDLAVSQGIKNFDIVTTDLFLLFFRISSMLFSSFAIKFSIFSCNSFSCNIEYTFKAPKDSALISSRPSKNGRKNFDFLCLLLFSLFMSIPYTSICDSHSVLLFIIPYINQKLYYILYKIFTKKQVNICFFV